MGNFKRGFGRIEFDGRAIDLPRPWTAFSARRPVSEAPVQAASGKEQTLTLFKQWFINARINLTEPQIASEMQRLFEYGENGQTFTIIRDRDVGSFWNFEGGENPAAAPRALQSNDNANGTFSVTGVINAGYYWDRATELLRLAGATGTNNVPRLERGSYGDGLVIERGSTNLIDDSIATTVANGWVHDTITHTPGTTETLDPEGGFNADKVTANAANQGLSYATSDAISTDDGACSIRVKCDVGTVDCRLFIRSTVTGALGTNNFTATTEWTEIPFNVNHISSGSVAGNWQLGLTIINNTESIYIFGAQIEAGVDVKHVTRFIKTTGSQITRNPESFLIAAADANVNQLEGTILFDFRPDWDFDGHPQAWLFTSSSGTDEYLLLFVSATGGFELDIRDGSGTVIGQILTTASGLIKNQVHRIAFTYDVRIPNGVKLYLDGVQIGSTSVNTAFNPRAIGTTISLGSRVNKSFQAGGVFDELMILRRVLTDSEILGIQNLSMGQGINRNRWTVRFVNSTWNPDWLSSDVYDIPLQLKEVL